MNHVLTIRAGFIHCESGMRLSRVLTVTALAGIYRHRKYFGDDYGNNYCVTTGIKLRV